MPTTTTEVTTNGIQNGDRTVFGVIERGFVSQVEVYTSEFRGENLLHVREFYRGDDTNWHPTKKGIALRDKDQLDDLIKALTAAKKTF